MKEIERMARGSMAFPGLVVAGGLLLSACGDAPRDATPPEGPVTAVTVRTAELTSAPRTVVVSGGIEPWRRVEPGTKILGRIEAVPAREGERVERGQLLARLESRDLEAAVAQAQAAVAMAEAQRVRARAQYERMVRLLERGSVTEKDLEDATAAFRVTEAAVEQAEANLAAARVDLGYARVVSPIDGWVVARLAEAGDMASPGHPLFALEDVSRVKVMVEVAESEVVGLTVGTGAEVEIGALGRSLEATVDRIAPAGDPGSRTFEVRLLLDNPDGTIKSGMFARARLRVGERRLLLVPDDAVVRRGQLEGLFVVEGGHARLRWVKTGGRVDGQRLLLSGLEVGDRYVHPVPQGLVDGSRVEPR